MGAPVLPAWVMGPYVEPTMFGVVDLISGMSAESPMPMLTTLHTAWPPIQFGDATSMRGHRSSFVGPAASSAYTIL